jgi:hypothetical protein
MLLYAMVDKPKYLIKLYIIYRWQELLMNQIIPAYQQSIRGNAPYSTNLTRLTTLVCNPHIQITSKLVRAIGGSVNLENVPDEYSAGVGNMDKMFVSYMVYSYAVQQAMDLVSKFRPNILIGGATGNATLTSDPSNPAGGTIPKSPVNIAPILVMFTFRISLFAKIWLITTTGCIYWIFEQSLDDCERSG